MRSTAAPTRDSCACGKKLRVFSLFRNIRVEKQRLRKQIKEKRTFRRPYRYHWRSLKNINYSFIALMLVGIVYRLLVFYFVSFITLNEFAKADRHSGRGVLVIIISPFFFFIHLHDERNKKGTPKRR